jgi:hypothetical protein
VLVDVVTACLTTMSASGAVKKLGSAGRWTALCKRRLSTTPGINLSKALVDFYNEREALLRQSMSALLRSKRKQEEGLRPRSIESTIASLSNAPLTTQPVDDEMKAPLLDFSNLFHSTATQGKQGTDVRQRAKALAAGSVLSAKLIPETQDIVLAVFIPQPVVDVLSQPTNEWRLKTMETGYSNALSIRLFPQRDKLVSCANIRGQEGDIVRAYQLLMLAVDHIMAIQRTQEPLKSVQLENVKEPISRIMSRAEMLSGAFIQADGTAVKIWGSPMQVQWASAYLDIVQDAFVTSLSIKWRNRDREKLESNALNGAQAHLATATFIVPTPRLGIIVGKDAILFRQMKETTGARVKFDPIPTAAGFVFTASGSIKSVHDVVHETRSRLTEYERYLRDVEWREHVALRDREELRRLVGHEFVNIRKIELMSGAFLRVSPPGDPVLSVRIWGTSKSVESAVKSVYALIRLDSPAVISTS